MGYCVCPAIGEEEEGGDACARRIIMGCRKKLKKVERSQECDKEGGAPERGWSVD